MTIDLSIVVPVYNRFNFTMSMLNDLFRLTETTHEIILVDNASSDKTQEELTTIKRNNFIYIRNEENRFHSAACNQGYKISTGNNILFLNNDIRVLSNHNNWTDAIINNCKDAVVGPTMGLLDGKLSFVREANEQLNGNSYISGWCIGSSRDIWSRIENEYAMIWDEKYPFYYNDVSLSLNAKAIEIQLKVVSLPINHYKRVSANQFNIQKLYLDGKNKFMKEYGRK